ncbi:MAG TPA: TetR/AcrR family transcriptional regulator [Nocardioidaceae bacterium]|nr:TetR/AcrR family transcriptional regulator [Nocardioidaceae bacterium]
MAEKASAAVVADERRDQMLAAAAALIAERGFGDTRIADVAERVGASPPLVVYYFGTKDKLLTEALRYSEQSFYKAADEMLASTSAIVKRLETLVAWTCLPDDEEEETPGTWGLWFDLWAQAFRHPEVKKDRVELDQRWRAMIARVVREGMDAGEIDTVDAEEFAIAFAALMDGLSIQTALDDPVVDGQRAYRVAMRFASTSLGFTWKYRRRRAGR